MFLVGDIGNTDTKICLVNSKKIVRKINFPSKNVTNIQLKKKFRKLKLQNLKLNSMMMILR